MLLYIDWIWIKEEGVSWVWNYNYSCKSWDVVFPLQLEVLAQANPTWLIESVWSIFFFFALLLSLALTSFSRHHLLSPLQHTTLSSTYNTLWGERARSIIGFPWFRIILNSQLSRLLLVVFHLHNPVYNEMRVPHSIKALLCGTYNMVVEGECFVHNEATSEKIERI